MSAVSRLVAVMRESFLPAVQMMTLARSLRSVFSEGATISGGSAALAHASARQCSGTLRSSAMLLADATYSL